MRLLLAFLLLLLPGCDEPRIQSFAPAIPTTLKSQGRRISVAVQMPERIQPRLPAIILLPGRAGLGFYGDQVNQLAKRLNSRGYVAVIPQYLGRSPGEVPEQVDRQTFELWQHTVADIVGFAERLPSVDRTKIGIAAFSLGAFVSSVQAASDPRIAALAINSAGLSDHFPQKVRKMPPTLIIHARNDPIVPLAQAEALLARSRRSGGDARLLIIEGNEHIASGGSWLQSMEAMVRFFDTSLR